MYDGTTWLVTTDGTIGVLLADSTTFEAKHHAKQYHSWRLSNTYASDLPCPVTPPSITDLGFNGSVRFPYFKDIIGFQTDVDKCVIFNIYGELLYEGDYDGRRFPLFYNGHDRKAATLDQYRYLTAPIRFPIVNDRTSAPHFGETGKIRWQFDEEEDLSEEEETEPKNTLRPVLDRLGSGFAAVAWATDSLVSHSDPKRCGYSPDKDYSWYSSYKMWACKDATQDDTPSGDVSAAKVFLQRDLVQTRMCPDKEQITNGWTNTKCEVECETKEVTKYHKCVTTFKPDTPLEHQIQGFELNLCGNFIRVILRNHQVSSNKWYRFVGTVPSASKLPKYLPKDFNVADLFPGGYGNVPQDDWGIPEWWFDYLQTFYVYGSHEEARWQWMRFPDQCRRDIKNIAHLFPTDSAQAVEEWPLSEAGPTRCSQAAGTSPQCPCEISGNAEKVLGRSAQGVSPIVSLEAWHEKDNPDGWNPHIPTSYGIRQFDVMSVGSGTDGDKRWYYFDGLDWVEGEGSYQDLKNWSHEDLNIIFYKGVESLNMCDPHAHIIPANAGRIRCCGDYLLIGLGTDYESRMIYLRDKEMLNFTLGGFPQPWQYGKESFACCDSFFGVTVLTSTSQVRTFFYDLLLDEDGFIVKQQEIWSGDFNVEEAPQFSGCNSDCRYYFVRQTNKKGLYFYRDVVYKKYGVVEYGRWRFLRSLNINEGVNNSAPSSGCVSTKDDCVIPCEPVHGYQKYTNGVLVDPVCEAPPKTREECSNSPWETTFSGSAACTDGWGNPFAQDVVSAVASGTIERCNHLTYESCCGLAEEYHLTSQTVVLEYKSMVVTSGGTTYPGVPGRSENGNYYNSSLLALFNATGNNTVLSASRSSPFGEGEYKKLSTDIYDANHQFVESLTHTLCACGHTLYLLRQDGAVVDTVAVPVPSSPDWSKIPVGGSGPKATWDFMYGVLIAGGTGGATNCLMSSGEITTGFTLPNRSLSQQSGGTYMSMSWTVTAGYGASIVLKFDQHVSYGGSADPIGSYSVYRVDDAQYYIEPYSEKIISIHTGVRGTTCYGSNTDPGTCGQYSVCYLGERYTVYLASEWKDANHVYNKASLVRQGCPEYIETERRVDTNCTLAYHGRIFSDDNNDGLLLSNGSGGYSGGESTCTSDDSCDFSGGKATAKVRNNDKVVVDIKFQNYAYRYSRSGYVSSAVPKIKCCGNDSGPYTILHLAKDAIGFLYFKDQFITEVSSNASFNACCGYAAVVKEGTGLQRVFIDGVEIEDTSNIFQDNKGAVNNATHPLRIKCDDDYYLFYHESGTEFELVDRYTPFVKYYSLQCEEPRKPTDICEEDKAKEDWWKLYNALSDMDPRKQGLVLLDGTPCIVTAIGSYLCEEKKKDGTQPVWIGPTKWRTQRKDKSNTEYEFDDPFAPYWEKGQDRKINSPEGTMSLLRTLFGDDFTYDEVEAGIDPLTSAERAVRSREQQLLHIERQIDLQTTVTNAVCSTPGKQGECSLEQGQLIGLQGDLARAEANLVLAQQRYEYLLANPSAADSSQYPSDSRSGGTWLFGFRVKKGQNIAAAYYKTTFLYNDSRMRSVKSYCDGAFGVFYFSGAGYYLWDTPVIERENSYEEEAFTNALDNVVYRYYKSHFAVYQGLPNPLPHKQLGHEFPRNTEDWAALGDWLQKYTPYGAYVFNRTDRLSDLTHVSYIDDIEPPFHEDKGRLDNRPPYNEGFKGSDHPFGDFLYFNDRNAPVRYDRALSWERPFDDQCDHQKFQMDTSLDLLRSPFTAAGDRVVVGANGAIYVFDDKLGRMDFNAQTLESL